MRTRALRRDARDNSQFAGGHRLAVRQRTHDRFPRRIAQRRRDPGKARLYRLARWGHEATYRTVTVRPTEPRYSGFRSDFVSECHETSRTASMRRSPISTQLKERR